MIKSWLKSIFEYFNISANDDKIIGYIGMVIEIIIILIMTKVLLKILSSLIHKFFERQKISKFGFNERKADTLSALLKNILRYVLYFVALMWIFETIGFKLKTVLAFTSIAGVAVGFGAQSLVKDVITGFFILFEDQFAVGDYVTIEGMSGTVEVLGLRITKIRDFSGDLHIIPNGSISKVTNKSRGEMSAVVEVVIDYEEDVDNVIDIIKGVSENMKNDFEDILSGPDVLGITKMGPEGIVIKIVAKTVAMKQGTIEMEFRRRIKHEFHIKGIKVPSLSRIILKNQLEVRK